MWNREAEQKNNSDIDENIDAIDLFDWAEFEKFDVHPTTLKLKCGKCFHVWIIDVRNPVNPIKMICSKCAQRKVLNDYR